MIEIMRITVNILSSLVSAVLNDSFMFLKNAPMRGSAPSRAPPVPPQAPEGLTRKPCKGLSTTNLSSSGVMLLLTYAPIASEIVNTDRTIRIGDNKLFFKKKTLLKKLVFS